MTCSDCFSVSKVLQPQFSFYVAQVAILSDAGILPSALSEVTAFEARAYASSLTTSTLGEIAQQLM